MCHPSNSHEPGASLGVIETRTALHGHTIGSTISPPPPWAAPQVSLRSRAYGLRPASLPSNGEVHVYCTRKPKYKGLVTASVGPARLGDCPLPPGTVPLPVLHTSVA